MKAYYYDNLPGDQRLPHDSGRAVSPAQLESIGVFYRSIDSLDGINQLANERGYKNRDEVNVSPASFGESYNEKLGIFFAEHLHDDEEIRYILDGEGFFDVRSVDDDWIRCKVERNDLLILPAGIYHRFTTSSTDYIKAMRLFQDEPKWVPHNRPADGPSRQEYLKSLKV